MIYSYNVSIVRSGKPLPMIYNANISIQGDYPNFLTISFYEKTEKGFALRNEVIKNLKSIDGKLEIELYSESSTTC